MLTYTLPRSNCTIVCPEKLTVDEIIIRVADHVSDAAAMNLVAKVFKNKTGSDLLVWKYRYREACFETLCKSENLADVDLCLAGWAYHDKRIELIG